MLFVVNGIFSFLLKFFCGESSCGSFDRGLSLLLQCLAALVNIESPAIYRTTFNGPVTSARVAGSVVSGPGYRGGRDKPSSSPHWIVSAREESVMLLGNVLSDLTHALLPLQSSLGGKGGLVFSWFPSFRFVF